MTASGCTLERRLFDLYFDLGAEGAGSGIIPSASAAPGLHSGTACSVALRDLLSRPTCGSFPDVLSPSGDRPLVRTRSPARNVPSFVRRDWDSPLVWSRPGPISRYRLCPCKRALIDCRPRNSVGRTWWLVPTQRWRRLRDPVSGNP